MLTSTLPDRAIASSLQLPFDLDDRHTAHEPPEARGLRRDHIRLMVSRGLDPPEHARFDELPSILTPGDLLVVNTSATVPAAIDAELPGGRAIVIHLSTQLPGGLWMVEPRTPIPGGATRPLTLDPEPTTARLAESVEIQLLRPAPGSRRLWLAAVDDGLDLLGTFMTRGRPIRYPYVEVDWPIEHYQTVFATEPGSAEMPSAARPFTDQLVTRLIGKGIGVAPLTLHTGVSSLEGHELPYPERFEVPETTAATVNAVRQRGARVIAVGTTVVRALESAADTSSVVHPASGWTDLVVSPERGINVVDGLITGWHEPEATHLAMIEAVAGREPLQLAYQAAWHEGYRWHEFGDSHILLKGGKETRPPTPPGHPSLPLEPPISVGEGQAPPPPPSHATARSVSWGPGSAEPPLLRPRQPRRTS